MEDYYIIYQKGKYLEEGIEIKSCVDGDEVEEFLTESLNTERVIRWIIRGKPIEWETYETQVKARIKPPN